MKVTVELSENEMAEILDFTGESKKGPAYNISNGLTAGHNLSYDQAFETRFSADLKYRFGSNGYGAPSAKKEWKSPVIQALTENVKHRDVRVHYFL